MINIYSENEQSFQTNGLGVLNCKSCFITEEINGEYSLELELPKDERDKYKLVQPWRVIKADEQLFRIPTQENIQETGITIKAFANHISSDLSWDWIEDAEVNNVSVEEALQTVVTNPKFSILPCDNLGLNTTRFKSVNPYKALFDIISVWGGELYRNNFDIAIKNTIGQDNGVLIKYGKNILGFNEIVDNTNIATRVIPIGAEGITIEGINNGINYIDSPKINDYPFVIKREIAFNNITNEVDLLAAAQRIWGVVDVLEKSYVVNFAELSKTEQYKGYAVLENVELGDMVIVKHSIFGIDMKLKVVKTTKDVLKNRLVEIVLGSTRKSITDFLNSIESSFVNSIRGLESDLLVQKTAITQNSTDINLLATRTGSAEGRLTTAEASINVNAEDIGLIASRTDTVEGRVSEAEASINVNAEDIGLIVTRTTNVEDRVETAEANIGINADEIELKVSKTGVVSAINLSTEGLKINTNRIDITNAVIGWTQISNAPDFIDPSELANQLANYVSDSELVTELARYITTGTFSQTLQNYVTSTGLTTILGQDYIITGRILANQIASGTITGVTINVIDDARVGDVLTVGSGSSYIKLKNVSGNAYINCNNSDLMRLYANGLWVNSNIAIPNGESIGVFTSGLTGSSWTGVLTLSQNQADFFTSGTGAAVNIYGKVRLGSMLGFFNATPVSKTSVNDSVAIVTTQSANSTYASNEQNMLNNLKADVNNLKNKQQLILNALQSYNLV